MRRLSPFLAACLLAACAGPPPQGRTPYEVSPAMLRVLRERQNMHAQDPSSFSTVAEARDVPNLAAAARAVENVQGLPAPVTPVPQVTQVTASGADGTLAARLYRPVLARNTPFILFFPGGTWATGSLDASEESARQLAARTGWVVLSVRTRLAPDTPFPAEHEDAAAAYNWARAHLREWGADPTRVALVGEGPGANLALATALAARDQVARGFSALPDQLVLITPWAGTSLRTLSMRENSRSQPLTRAAVEWSQDLYAPNDLRDPRMNPVGRTDLAGLPPTTLVLAPIDPMRSSGEDLAARLAAAGVPTQGRLFPGVTAEFFGLGDKIPEAAAAEDYVAARLRTAFFQAPDPVLPPPAPPHARTRRRR